MKIHSKVTFVTILLLLFFVFECGKENVQSFQYFVKVKIDPATNRIDGEVRIQHPPDSCFYLNPNLEIRQVTANGHPVTFQHDSTKYLPYTVGTAINMQIAPGSELHIAYTGRLREMINGVNLVDSVLVELALYAAWYPMFKGNPLFDFHLEADLPVGFITVTNGKAEKQQTSQGRNLTTWSSFKPGFDIVLVASPKLKRITANSMGTEVEMYFDKMSREYLESKRDRLTQAMHQFSEYYGPPRITGLLRFVYSPRGGWGYARIPIFVVSEAYALSLLEQEFGSARDFHGAVHEMAHFWWMIADPNTPDDWINEGLAEYSAFRLSEKYFGQNFTNLLIAEYQEHAAQSQTETAIAETESSSADRYVNRYEKMTLIFIEARERFGTENLDQVFREMHRQFADSKQATTAHFLEEIEKQLGSETQSFFNKVLFQKTWSDPNDIE